MVSLRHLLRGFAQATGRVRVIPFATALGLGVARPLPMAFPRLSSAAQKQLLDAIVARSHKKPGAPPPVVVFDLDGTLFDNRPRSLAILHELATRWQEREPEAAAALTSAKISQLAYLLTESLANVGVTRTDLIADAEVFWRDRFFVDPYLKHDRPLAGAVRFAKDCYEAGALLLYFTGRDLPLMGPGTFASLRDSGFPIGVVGTELVLKPDAAMPDEAFKRLVGADLARVGDVIAIFDNEPGNCNVLGEHFPSADSCFVDTQHLPGAPALSPSVKVILDFQR